MLSALSGGQAVRGTRTRARRAGRGALRLAPRRERPPRPSRPRRRGWEGEACVWSRRRVRSGAILPRAENWARDPGVTTPPLAPPPAFLPGAKGTSLTGADSGVALLSWPAVPGRCGEESEAVLALISGSLDQPAGEAGAGSAPPRRGPGAGAPRGPWVLPAGPPRPAPGTRGTPGMLLRGLPDQPGLLFLSDENLLCLRKKNTAKLGSYI